MSESMKITRKHAELLALACESYARQLRERPSLVDNDDDAFETPEARWAADQTDDYFEPPEARGLADYREGGRGAAADDYFAAQLDSLANMFRGINPTSTERSR